MKKRDVLKKYYYYRLYECVAVEEFLEEMALDGWMVVAVKGYWFTFQRMEPQKFLFTVDILYKSPDPKTKPDQAQREYLELCWEDGWALACADSKIQIFCSNREAAVSIPSDDCLKLKAINWSVLWSGLYICLIGPFLAYGVIARSWGRDFEYTVTEYDSMGSISMFFILVLFAVFSIINYSMWMIPSMVRIKKGENIKYYSIKEVKRRQRIRTTFFLILIAIPSTNILYPLVYKFSSLKILFTVGCILMAVTILFLYLQYRKRKNQFRVKTRVFDLAIAASVTILITAFFLCARMSLNTEEIASNKVPITLEDFGMKITGDRDSYAACKETFLARIYDYSDSAISGDEPRITYSVFTSPYDWVLKQYVKSKCLVQPYGLSFSKGDETLWEADAVYMEEEWGYLIIVYGDKVVEFNADIAYTTEQIAVIREKLKL